MDWQWFFNNLLGNAELNMKDVFHMVREKELAIERARKEIAALRFVIPLVTELSDVLDNVLYTSSLPSAGGTNPANPPS